MSDWSRLYNACKDATGTEIADIYDAHLVVEELDGKCRKLTKENDLLRSVSQRSELLAFKRFISKTPLAELELYSDEEFTDLYIKANCG